MNEKHDIRNRADIELLINAFYSKVPQDELIGFFFTEVAHVDWPAHLPRMYAFWESIAFGTGAYKGEPMSVHLELNAKQKLEPQHFERWLALFRATVDELFSGEKASELKERAASIARIMELKTGG